MLVFVRVAYKNTDLSKNLVEDEEKGMEPKIIFKNHCIKIFKPQQSNDNLKDINDIDMIKRININNQNKSYIH